MGLEHTGILNRAALIVLGKEKGAVEVKVLELAVVIHIEGASAALPAREWQNILLEAALRQAEDLKGVNRG